MQNKQKTKQSYKFGPSTDMGMIQAPPVAHSMKSVVRGASPSVDTLRVRLHPHHRLLGPSSVGSCMEACIVSLGQFPNLPVPNQPHTCISRWVELTIHTHLIWALIHYHTLVLFYLLVVFGASKAIKQGLAPQKKEKHLGMNTMKNSSKVLLSYLQHSYAIELEYSFDVIS